MHGLPRCARSSHVACFVSTTGACLEYLLKNGVCFLIMRLFLSLTYPCQDVLGTLVKLSESDRPFGIQAEVLRAVQNMVVLLDEQFLVHSAVHKAVLRLLRNCAGDDLQEQLDGRNRPMGAAGNTSRTQPSEYEEDCAYILLRAWIGSNVCYSGQPVVHSL